MLALAWSGGKDSALALEALRESGRGPDMLMSTVDRARSVVPHHEVPIELLRRQASAAGLPLVEVDLPTGSENETYEERMRAAFAGPLADVMTVAFGDLFLADLRRYREDRLREAGRDALFPLWGRDTRHLARDFARRYRAVVCSVDRELVGREPCPGADFDERFLESLPATADPCGERGEFHTFVHDGPVFGEPIPLRIGDASESEDGRFAHVRLAPGQA